MNEKIKELATQAGYGIRWTSTEQFERFMEKFAELIIKECADYIRTNYDSWDAEPLAFNMEKDFGLHGDYAE